MIPDSGLIIKWQQRHDQPQSSCLFPAGLWVYLRVSISYRHMGIGSDRNWEGGRKKKKNKVNRYVSFVLGKFFSQNEQLAIVKTVPLNVVISHGADMLSQWHLGANGAIRLRLLLKWGQLAYNCWKMSPQLITSDLYRSKGNPNKKLSWWVHI